MEITNEIKNKVESAIAQTINATFGRVPLYEYIRAKQYSWLDCVEFTDGEFILDPKIEANFDIIRLEDAETGYKCTVQVMSVGHKDEFDTNFDGWQFQCTTTSGKMSFPIESVIK